MVSIVFGRGLGSADNNEKPAECPESSKERIGKMQVYDMSTELV